MAKLDCKDEVIVDLFAGIGYFVLPFLVRYCLFEQAGCALCIILITILSCLKISLETFAKTIVI